ncbi:DNA-directed RNA polymerase subunit delta [Alkalicoccus halolimnae]|uniref:Probable DNA-directed RNA polymerase subunit delta n=1 Tax=Alkalicoccus halolimnae TaxID=1667239 RepID=A0A5C7FBU1_9BACI|nr:DNA-directed RNA polymerase subunit delta [Alkalicoccus halolimnae]TXF86928.1 DNA-directed RNA polymerase subunit delta [Alkalicoccus halolimnae]
MSLKDYTEEQLKEISMLDVTFELLDEKNSPEDYGVLIDQVGEIQGLSQERKHERIAHLYTQMSLDGRFVNLGDNRWALRSWYPFEQTEEELSQMMPKKRKAAKEEEGFDDELEEYDEFEDIEDELDELANEEDTDTDELDEDEFGDTAGEVSEDEKDEEESEEEK